VDVTTRLRAAREQAGLSIQEVSARTRIKPAMIDAIEHGAWDALPGEFFARAFTRTYARELGLPEAEILAEFEKAVPHVAAPVAVGHENHRPELPEMDGSGARTMLVSAALIVLAAAGVYFLNRPDEAAQPEPLAVGTFGQAAAPAAPAGPTPSVPPPAQGTSLTIELRPTRPVWVTGIADGERVLFRLVEPGERINVDAKERLTFRVGDAGAFEFTLNGAPGKPVGRSGEVREFTITHANASAYLR
jgi:cytoskeleton protein RodZ